jgi:hypothetical protein
VKARGPKLKYLQMFVKTSKTYKTVVIFPNPNTGIFTLRVPKNQTGNLKVVNMLGQTVYENSFSAVVERVFVNIPSLSKGVYNLSVFINNKTVVRNSVLLNSG